MPAYCPNSSSAHPPFLESLKGILKVLYLGVPSSYWVTSMLTSAVTVRPGGACYRGMVPLIWTWLVFCGLSLRDRVRSSALWEELRVEPLLLHFEKSQLRLLGCLLDSMSLWGRPRTRWRDCLSAGLGTPWDSPRRAGWSNFGGEVWASLLRLPAPRPDPG